MPRPRKYAIANGDAHRLNSQATPANEARWLNSMVVRGVMTGEQVVQLIAITEGGAGSLAGLTS